MNYIKSFKKRKSNKFNIFIIVVGIMIVIILFFMFSNNKSLNSNDINTNTDVENMIENTSRYVVGISRQSNLTVNPSDFWGSGVIVSKKGFILTNAHVSGKKGSTCNVIFDDNNFHEGLVVWASDSIDLAIIKINEEFSDCINIGDYGKARVGQEIFCIGNPISKSFQKTVSKGIISGVNRNIEFDKNDQKYYMSNLIQTDAAINYGSSGGALIDKNGNLIGINTIKITDAELMSFAVRADIVAPIINKLNTTGKFDECGLKIWCFDKYNINESNITRKINNGVLVAKIEADSNAEKAGVRTGDVIRYVDTGEINTVADLKKIIFDKNVGDKVILKIERNNREIFIIVKLEKID